MSVAIIDYGSGNLHSAHKAFERAARAAHLTLPVKVTHRPDDVREASHIVLPGVGAFADCRAGLGAVAGMDEALREAALKAAKPFFGICVGMQMLASRGLEHGSHEGLGWIPGDVVRINPNDKALKVPHMGWNTLDCEAHPLFDNLPTGSRGLHAYFVHSYHFVPQASNHRVARTDYGEIITAAVVRDNLFGTQFHPEKSQALGLQLITNFLRWRP